MNNRTIDDRLVEKWIDDRMINRMKDRWYMDRAKEQKMDGWNDNDG